MSNNFFREMERLHISIPALPHPTIEGLKGKCPWIRYVKSDVSSINAGPLVLGTVLRSREESILSAEYELRCSALAGRVTGFEQLRWLADHQDELPFLVDLLRGDIHIDGPGLVAMGGGGTFCSPYLLKGCGRWFVGWRRVESVFSRHGRLALVGE